MAWLALGLALGVGIAIGVSWGCGRLPMAADDYMVLRSLVLRVAADRDRTPAAVWGELTEYLRVSRPTDLRAGHRDQALLFLNRRLADSL